MTDTRRIQMISDILAIWAYHPEQRLGQLIANLCRPEGAAPNVYHMPDEVLADRANAVNVQGGFLALDGCPAWHKPGCGLMEDMSCDCQDSDGGAA